MSTNTIECIISDDWDYKICSNTNHISLRITQEECEILNNICKKNKRYIEFSLDYTEKINYSDIQGEME